MKRPILTLLLILTLTACSVTNQVKVADYQRAPENRLPVVAVFSKTPPDQLAADCEAYNRAALDSCMLNHFDLSKLRRELKASEAFTDVLHADRTSEYRLAFATATYMPADAEGFASALAAGATLMLAPMVQKMEIHISASLLWHDIELTVLEYKIPFEMRASLLAGIQDNDGDIARSIASHLIRDLQGSDYFSAGFLADHLQSTNYGKSLAVPEQVAGYERRSFVVFHHPFWGARIDYQSVAEPMDSAEVYVYPVRAADWRQTHRLLDKESDNERQSIEKYLTEAEVTSPRIGRHRLLIWQIGAATLDASCLEANYSDQLENAYTVRTCIAIVEDKFVKIRHKSLNSDTAAADTERLATQLLATMRVPGESPFMGKIRAQWRQNEPL